MENRTNTEPLFPEKKEQPQSLQYSGEIKPELTEERTQTKEELPLWLQTKEKPQLPAAFHVSRYHEQAIKEIERTLFDEYKEQEENGQIVRKSESGAVLQMIPTGLSELTFSRLDFALAQVLYNTSYWNKTTDKNTGLLKDGNFADGRPAPVNRVGGKEYSYAEIAFPLTGITSAAFGLKRGEKPTNAMKQEIKEAIEILHKKGCKITYENGDEQTERLILIAGEYYRKEDGALFYRLLLHPVYTMQLQKGTAAFPQNVMQRLKDATGKMTTAKLKLMRLLAANNLNKPFTRYKSTLLRDLDMMEEYKILKKRTDEKLKGLFLNMREINLLQPTAPNGQENPVEDIGANGEIKYTFYLNPDFVGNNQAQIENKSKGEA